MVEIEQALHKLHDRERAKRKQDEAEAQEEAMEQQVSLPPPFARVDAVTQGSPACGAVSDIELYLRVRPFVHKDQYYSLKLNCVAVLTIGCFSLKGLRVGDEVIEFGSVNAKNFQNLQNIASVVQHSEGVRYVIYSALFGSAVKCFIFSNLEPYLVIWLLCDADVWLFVFEHCTICYIHTFDLL